MTRLHSISPIKPQATVHFDWISVTFPIKIAVPNSHCFDFDLKIGRILQQLCLDKLSYVPLKKGMYNYNQAVISGDNSITVAWHGIDDNYAGSEIFDLPKSQQNWLLQLSGSGVETLESCLHNVGLDVAYFIKTCVKFDGQFTRVDACANFFNYDFRYSAGYCAEQARLGNLITKSRSVKVIHSFSSNGELNDHEMAFQGASEGYTLYVGRIPKQLRIYNKLAERSAKINRLYNVKSWSRWEFQLNGDQAQGFIDNYIQRKCDLVITWTNWLASNYRFISRVGHQQKKSRYPTASWFKAIIKNADQKIKVRKEAQKPTYERSKMWLQKQVLPTLISMVAAREKKYRKNGMSFVDAHHFAIKKVIADNIENGLVNGDQKDNLISAFLQENWRSL